MRGSNLINYLLPQRAATVQTLGHPAQGVIGWMGGTTNTSGVVVDASSALTFSAVWCAVRVISETIGTLPCLLYRRKSDDTRERADEDDRYWLMSEEPHPLMNACTFFESQTGQMVLRGNAFNKIVRAQNGDIARLEPRLPDNVSYELDGETIRYKCSDPQEDLRAEEMLHIPGMGSDGIQGWSVIKFAQQSIGAGLAGDSRAAGQFGNGATPNGVLKFPTRLDKDARNKFRQEWNDQHQGASKAGNIAILHGGMEFLPISMTNEDAQFLQSRQFNIREIARWFRLPPHMLADLADSSVRANIEQQAIEFIVYSLKPWMLRWEQTLNRKLLTKDERRDYYFEFLTESLLRGDSAAQSAAWSVGRQWGWYSVNDIRRMMNLPPIDGGDIYMQPSNMVEVGDDEEPPPPAPPPGFGPPPPDPDADEEDDSEDTPATVTDEMQKNLATSLNAILDQGRSLHLALATERTTVEDAVREANDSLSVTLNGMRQVRDEIRHDLAAPRKTQVRGWEDGRLAVKGACEQLLRREVGICQRVEKSEVTKATKKVSRGQNFVAWSDHWYGEFQSMLSDRIAEVVACYAKVGDVPTDFASDMATDYCQKHQHQLLDAADGEAATFPQRVQSLMESWHDDVSIEIQECRHVA